MATTPTSNPIPSEAPQDLKFNAGKIDEFVTSQGWTYTDRFGVKRYTIEGIIYLSQQVMSAFGYVTLTGVTFTTGATITQPNEVLFNTADNSYYKWTGSLAAGSKVVPANSTPATSGGVGPGKWLSVGDSTLKPLLDVTANVVGSNNYSTLPAIGGYLTAGSDYLYNNILYATAGSSGTIQSITDNVITTTGGTAYLLDKRWPVNDVRAWGVMSDVIADQKLIRAISYINTASGGIRSVYIPPIALLITSIELRDLSNLNIHFDGTYIVGATSTTKRSVIDIINAKNLTITGNCIWNGKQLYTYGISLRAGLPSTLAPLTGLLSNVSANNFSFINFQCAQVVGDGSDLQISEIYLNNIKTNNVNCALEANGSQVIVNISGALLCEPQSGYTYPKGVHRAIGGIIYHNGGEAVCSVDSDSTISRVSQSSSTLYGNPFGSVKMSGVHIETTGFLMITENASAISGSSDSKYSNVSFSNCQGAMLNGGQELIICNVSDYEGTFSADETCNFYSGVSRSKRIVYSLSPLFCFDVWPRAFRKGFGVLASEIGSGNVNWKHWMQPIIYLIPNVITINNGSSSPLGFSTRKNTGDYLFYYADTSTGGIVLTHSLDSMIISISVLSSAGLTITVNVNGVESFSCQNGGSVTLTRDQLTIGSVIEFIAKNSSGSSVTLASSSRIVVSGSNKD